MWDGRCTRGGLSGDARYVEEWISRMLLYLEYHIINLRLRSRRHLVCGLSSSFREVPGHNAGETSE